MMFTAVKRYNALGWPVLALRPCGKEPFARFCPQGVKNATTMDAVVYGWWRNQPDCNVGIACEKFCVVDIDPRNGGAEWMADMVGRYARLPPTPTARTGSGGFHYLFRLPSFELKGRAGPGVDIKKPGGYIVAAPSKTVDRYRWLRPPETPLAELPAWLQPLVRAEEPPPRISVSDIADVALERRIERAQAYLEHVEPAVQGQNGSTRTLVAAAHVTLGFMLEPDHAMFAMRDWNQRCQPPWSDRELRRKIDQASKGYRNIQPGQHLRNT